VERTLMPPADLPRPPDEAGASWAELWPTPPAGLAWADLGEGRRQALLVQDWHARWRGVPFPVSPDSCPVCRRLRGALAAPAGAGGRPGPARDPAEAADDHRSLHALLARELTALWAGLTGASATAQVDRIRAVSRAPAAADALLAEPALAAFVGPSWDTADGRPLLREPAADAGSTERSKAFLLHHRHRFGRFLSATMRDFERVGRGPGPAPGPLRLYDDRGRVLELGGLTAGYAGTGPRGTLWTVRVADLPEGPPEPSGLTDLERTVFGQRAFLWPPARPSAGR
jgi:hypothetical protein